MNLPSANAYEVHELLPKFDCGQCGNPICMTFARKLLLSIQNPRDCIFLKQEQMDEIKRFTGAVDRSRVPPAPPGGEVVEIHPCTEEGMVTLWAQLKPTCGSSEPLGDYFDQLQLCRSVAQADFFDKNECSPKMGYAYVELKGKRTHIFKTGKIIMRRADDKEDAVATLSKISRLLLPARVCSCGNLMADCFGGCCDDCFESTCRALSGGREEFTTPSTGEEVTVGYVLDQNYRTLNEAMKSNFKSIGALFGKIKEMAKNMQNGKNLDREASQTIFTDYENDIVRVCTDEFLGSERPGSIVIALTQFGLARDLIRAHEGFLSLESQRDEEAFLNASQLLFEAYKAFENRDVEASQKVQEGYLTSIDEWKRYPEGVGYAKIAANGFYISRILGKPVSDLTMFDIDKINI